MYFIFKTNTISLEFPTLALKVDRSRFKMFYLKACGAMSDFYVHIPFDHFLAGLSMPLDPTFAISCTWLDANLPMFIPTKFGTL